MEIKSKKDMRASYKAGPYRILLVDDEECLVYLLKNSLEEQGYLVEVASDGYEAVMKVLSWSPDLVIADIMMPFLSGYELISIVKSTVDFHIPFILISSLNYLDAQEKCLDLGSHGFLQKPINPEVLLNRVRNIFKEK